MIRFALAAAVGAVLMTASAAAAQVPERMDWRQKPTGPGIAVAIGFTPVRDGSQFATVMLRLPQDDVVSGTTIPYRGMEMSFEVRCGESRWRMLDGLYRDAGYNVVFESDGTDWSPLDRSQPLQTMVADICTGGHTEAIGLRNADTVGAQRWLDGRL